MKKIITCLLSLVLLSGLLISLGSCSQGPKVRTDMDVLKEISTTSNPEVVKELIERFKAFYIVKASNYSGRKVAAENGTFISEVMNKTITPDWISVFDKKDDGSFTYGEYTYTDIDNPIPDAQKGTYDFTYNYIYDESWTSTGDLYIPVNKTAGIGFMTTSANNMYYEILKTYEDGTLLVSCNQDVDKENKTFKRIYEYYFVPVKR